MTVRTYRKADTPTVTAEQWQPGMDKVMGFPVQSLKDVPLDDEAWKAIMGWSKMKGRTPAAVGLVAFPFPHKSNDIRYSLCPGDYLVNDAENSYRRVSAEDFEQLYIHISGDPPATAETATHIKMDQSKPPLGEPPLKATPGWIKWNKVNSLYRSCPTLTDICQHASHPGAYYSSDPVTAGHETTHGVNSDIRMTQGPGYNAFYCLGDNAYVLPEPQGVTLRQVAANVPQSLRGRNYQLYLVQQSGSWNNQPLYILDEATAYANGSAVRNEIGMTGREDTLETAVEFLGYVWTLWTLTQYSSLLTAFLQWHTERVLGMMIKGATYGEDFKRKLAFQNDCRGLLDQLRSMGDWAHRVLGL